MVKIALLGDIHLSQSKHKDFEANRFLALCDILSIKKYDWVIFMGDLLDKARPSLEELKLLKEGLNKIHAKKIVLDGNHEAVTKDSSTYDYIDIEGLDYVPYEALDIEGVKIHTMGYKNINKYLLLPRCDILLSHFRSNFGIIKEEVSTEEISKKANTVFLGDIHQVYSPLPNVHYTSSPYGIHFSKENHKHGYVELMVDNGTYEFCNVELDLPTKLILDLPIKACNSIKDTNNLVRVRVTGTSEELESLPRYSNVQYVVSLRLHEEEAKIHHKTDILESLLEIVSDTKEARSLLSRIYQEL